MSELYLIFFLVGLLVFGAIVAFSVIQQRKANTSQKRAYHDPLLDKTEESAQELETNKASKTKRPEAESSVKSSQNALPDQGRETLAELNQAQAVDSSAGSNEHPIEPSLNDDLESSFETKGLAGQETSRQAPTLDSPSDESGEAKSANEAPDGNSGQKSAQVHKAELAPKPKLDQESSTVVTELVARINNPEAIEQQGLLSLFRKHDFKFHRKVHIYGLNQLTDLWRDIEFELPSARFVELGISIQLADREGAMSQKELHDFQQMVLEFTNEYDAPFEFSMNIDEALKQALALDQVGRRYDSMAVLNVVPKSKSGFRMADIESCARDLMMSTDKNGIFMKTQGQKNNITILYRLACTDGSGQFGISSGSSTPVHDLVVYMNVPATKEPEMVFQEMVKDANSLATWLEGKVVDRQGRAMTQRSYSVLMQQVSDIAFSMQQDGFTPGDDVAKKLF